MFIIFVVYVLNMRLDICVYGFVLIDWVSLIIVIFYIVNNLFMYILIIFINVRNV